MKISPVMPNGKQALATFTGKAVRFSLDGKNKNATADTEKSRGETNPVVQVKNKSLEDIITNLKEQIEKVKKNDKLDEKAKKYKIDALTEQIAELEEMERRQKMEEAAKALEARKDEAGEKAKSKKSEPDKNADEKAVSVSISEEGFKSLVKARLELERAAEHKQVKSKKAIELTRAKIEQRQDKDYGQSMQNAIKAADSSGQAKKLSGEAIKEFEEKYGTINDFLAEADKSDMSAMGKQIGDYTKAMTDFVKEKVGEELNSQEFNSQYIYTNEEKDNIIKELEGVLGNFDRLITESLRKANDFAEGVQSDKVKAADDESSEASHESVNAIINEEVGKNISKSVDI